MALTGGLIQELRDAIKGVDNVLAKIQTALMSEDPPMQPTATKARGYDGSPCPVTGCTGVLRRKQGKGDLPPFWGCSKFRETGCRGKRDYATGRVL